MEVYSGICGNILGVWGVILSKKKMSASTLSVTYSYIYHISFLSSYIHVYSGWIQASCGSETLQSLF